MKEILFIGRGGQGLVSAASILAQAYLLANRHVLAFPKFGVERRGAIIEAFFRFDNKKIGDRFTIQHPDFIVFSDDMILKSDNRRLDGLSEGGVIVINSVPAPKDFAWLRERVKHLRSFRVVTVDATGIALDCGIGTKMNPITNTAIVGALARMLDFSLEIVTEVISKTVPNPEANTRAARQAFDNLVMIGFINSKISAVKKNYRLESPDYENQIVSVTTHDMTDNKTGDWRMGFKPALDLELCNRCGLCREFCPDSAVSDTAGNGLAIDYDYCKGCGICARMCPKQAISMQAEGSEITNQEVGDEKK
ncbi:MAG: 2-oxoacid:acceptor oxidoreductase family protein [Candidatus Falkowbacteria bacterium]